MNTLPLVTVIVPCFNGAKTIKRTIESVKSQTLNNLECIIVDDGSIDNSSEVIDEAAEGDARFAYLYQSNAGVANARNAGFYHSKGLFICCLDKDDAIAPTFLEVCVKALQGDRSLGIVYTGLQYIKPDGETGLSQWPGEWNYDEQLQGKNQLPTCNVARREVWERLGGQRQRYAPQGCGEEDAEMWLRAGAYGFKAKKVTNEGLFIYSWMSGQVSGNKEHKMTDYRSMHPWITDGIHPFASYATPKRWSHAVSQYDSPLISIIIPVGPGHEKEVINALDSLEMQHFRKWEAIVVWDFNPHENEICRAISKSYPYVRFLTAVGMAYPEGKSMNGAGWSRNLGGKCSRAPLLFFLDADDVLADPHALDKMIQAWNKEEAIIYSDYLGKAVWDYEEAVKAMGDDLLGYNEKTQTAVFKKQSADFDCTLAQRQPEFQSASNMPYYHWCLVSVLIPKIWHDEIGGFDEAMETWEDVDYMWRQARAGKCFHRVAEPLVMYSYHKGHRREKSAVVDEITRQKHQSMIQYIKHKYKGIEPKMCNCGQKRQPLQVNGEAAVAEFGNDAQFVMVEFDFMGGDTRDHFGKPLKSITGQRGPEGRVLDYKGYSRRRGERFLVHVQDQRARPDMFRLVSDVKLPEAPKVELAEPVLLVKARGKRAKVVA